MTSSDSRLPDEFSDEAEISNSSGRLRVAMEITVAVLILVGIYFVFAPEEQIELTPPLQEGQIDPIIRAQIDAAEEAERSPQDSEPDSDTAGTVSEPATDEATRSSEATTPSSITVEPATPDDETARTLISNMRSGKTTLSAAEVLGRAERYTKEGRLSDAYLLLFYAAREGDGQAAFTLASLHDPNHFLEGNTLLEKPDTYQAHKWYQAAAKQKVAGAQERLEDLRSVIEKQAESGDPSARRLLLNWR